MNRYGIFRRVAPRAVVGGAEVEVGEGYFLFRLVAFGKPLLHCYLGGVDGLAVFAVDGVAVADYRVACKQHVYLPFEHGYLSRYKLHIVVLRSVAVLEIKRYG